MKAYGHSRRDKLTCIYGCCGFKSMKFRSERFFVDKIKRKSARQSGKADIQFQIKEMDSHN